MSYCSCFVRVEGYNRKRVSRRELYFKVLVLIKEFLKIFLLSGDVDVAYIASSTSRLLLGFAQTKVDCLTINLLFRKHVDSFTCGFIGLKLNESERSTRHFAYLGDTSSSIEKFFNGLLSSIGIQIAAVHYIRLRRCWSFQWFGLRLI